MIKIAWCLFCTLILLTASIEVTAQKLIRGIIADSISLEGLPGVHCQAKNHAVVTDSKGLFVISVDPGDTITFSFIGYRITRVPIPVDEDVMFVRLGEASTLLDEVVIRDRRLILPKYIESPTLQSTKPLKASANGVNFAYFTREEKEKRKLVKVLAELALARTYIEIINEPAIRESIMRRNDLTEERYYALLAIFNQQNKRVMYSNNEGVILNSLLTYFENAAKKKQ